MNEVISLIVTEHGSMPPPVFGFGWGKEGN